MENDILVLVPAISCRRMQNPWPMYFSIRLALRMKGQCLHFMYRFDLGEYVCIFDSTMDWPWQLLDLSVHHHFW